ncbi:putative elongation factor TypA-like SVR3, chloroplastic [Camellia sinensis]|uniref:putative elongation factor TypA-like SVR3, chloroplastic n=1 Tax=Camellia sinensis TaxID=4442 RepID=UPI001036D4F6|nr:putative elongation factor TypA-like SVR3, chloroplastic [Camellia sinensis]
MARTDETCRYVRVSELFVYEKFSRVAAQAVEAGDICAVCGIDDIQIGETIADKISEKPLPAIKVEEPTVKMAFSINTSPFVGREVCWFVCLALVAVVVVIAVVVIAVVVIA